MNNTEPAILWGCHTAVVLLLERYTKGANKVNVKASKPNLRLLAFFIASMAVTNGAFAQALSPDQTFALNTAHREVAISASTKIEIERFAGDLSSCGIKIVFGDGATRDVRLEEGQGSIALMHKYVAHGTYTIELSGKGMVRGLRSAFPCKGSPQRLTVVVKGDVSSENAVGERPAVNESKTEVPESGSVTRSEQLQPSVSQKSDTSAAEPSATNQSVMRCPSGVNPKNWSNCTGTTKIFDGDDYQGDYTGEFRNGTLHGKGTFTTSQNGRYIGEFVDGRIAGRGSITYPDGGKYDGEFLNGSRHGHGTYTFPDGRVRSGYFERDQLVQRASAETQNDVGNSEKAQICSRFTSIELGYVEQFMVKNRQMWINFDFLFGSDGKVRDSGDYWRNLFIDMIRAGSPKTVEGAFYEINRGNAIRSEFGKPGSFKSEDIYQAMVDCSSTARAIASIAGERARKKEQANLEAQNLDRRRHQERQAAIEEIKRERIEAEQKAAQESATPQGKLKDIYSRYISMQACYESRKEYALQYVSNGDLGRARSITKRDETNLIKTSPELAKQKDRLWEDSKKEFANSVLGMWTTGMGAGTYIKDAATLCGLLKGGFNTDKLEQKQRIKKDF